MSTPLDAVYNRCRPVPLWSGSSNASQRRRVTTRCSKGYKREEGQRKAGSGKREAGNPLSGIAPNKKLAACAGAILIVPALLFAQTASSTPPTATPAAPTAAQSAPTSSAHPEVVNLTLKG